MSNMILFSLLEFCDTSIYLFFLVLHQFLFYLSIYSCFCSYFRVFRMLLWLVSCLVPCVVAFKWNKCCKASVLMQNSSCIFYIWESCFMQLSKMFRIIWNRKGIVKLGYFSRTDAKLPISNISSNKKWLKCSCSWCDYWHKWCWNSEASKKENTQHMKFIILTSDTCTVHSCIWAGLVDSLYNQWRNLEDVIHFLQRERCVYYSSLTLIGVQPNSSDKDIYPTNVWSGTYPSHWYCLGIL